MNDTKLDTLMDSLSPEGQALLKKSDAKADEMAVKRSKLNALQDLNSKYSKEHMKEYVAALRVNEEFPDLLTEEELYSGKYEYSSEAKMKELLRGTITKDDLLKTSQDD